MRRYLFLVLFVMSSLLVSCGDSGGSGGTGVSNQTYPNIRSALDNLGNFTGYQLTAVSYSNPRYFYYWIVNEFTPNYIKSNNNYVVGNNRVTTLPNLTTNPSYDYMTINSDGNYVLDGLEFPITVEVKDISGQTLKSNAIFKEQSVIFPAGSVMIVAYLTGNNVMSEYPFAMDANVYGVFFNDVAAKAIAEQWNPSIIPN